ncbi:hypothetical protein V2K50_26220 [Pseudomonas alliivorans]|uniref:hypothetical protein n=1 Tax=Pseudomonas alliivorans TaxID=2810613 RepID=UPI001F17A432|nr:hypothetical protein [Pseudomonas alliivorans]MEE4325871.1 hypothetical protein [Pseudomonas alliivorans]MEE4367401.1 hypothetical protein [Pseudomonas alliivorans]MEE5123342.1 hypothetical protein [Pseudomonas alliivorans]
MRQLAWDRLEDLRKLAYLRGGVNEGSRVQHLFWRLNFLLLSGATNSKQMYHEASSLAPELDPQWNSRSKELMTLFSKAKAYESGERVSFGGKDNAPLYTPKNDTLINLLGSPQMSKGSSRRSSVCGWPRSVGEASAFLTSVRSR